MCLDLYRIRWYVADASIAVSINDERRPISFKDGPHVKEGKIVIDEAFNDCGSPLSVDETWGVG